MRPTRFEGTIGRTDGRVDPVLRRATAPRRRLHRTSCSSCSTTPGSPSSGATAPTSTHRTSMRSRPDGVQFTNFHVTPLCSPTTGVAADRTLTTRCRHARRCRTSEPAFPNMLGHISNHAATVAEVLARRGLRHLLRRQVASRSDGAVLGRRAVRAVAAGARIRPVLRVPRGRDRPVPSGTRLRQPLRRSAAARSPRATTCPRISSIRRCG